MTLAASRTTILVAILMGSRVTAFVPNHHHARPAAPGVISSSSSTSLAAVPALVKRAKKEALKQYVTQGVPDEVMQIYKTMTQQVKETNAAETETAVDDSSTTSVMGPLQDALTRRKGTLTVIAEFRRKRETRDKPKQQLDEEQQDAEPAQEESLESASLNLDPDVLSPMFRASGVSGIAVLADERVGGCSLQDIQVMVTEQSRSQHQVPGPVIVINSDIIIDELQIAQSKALGVGAVLVSLPMNGADQTQMLLQCARAVDLECIVAVETPEQAQQAVDMGASMICVTNVDGADAKAAVIGNLHVPDTRKVTTIANIRAYSDNQWLEVEEAWAIRDKGFNCAWVGDALYKSGTDVMETPAAIIKALKSKSSVKFASPKVYTGKGEGAREYLGDILM